MLIPFEEIMRQVKEPVKPYSRRFFKIKWQAFLYKLDDFLWLIRNTIYPQNRLIRKAIPKHFDDVDRIMENVILACFKSYYEEQNPIDNMGDQKEIDELNEVYNSVLFFQDVDRYKLSLIEERLHDEKLDELLIKIVLMRRKLWT